MKNGVVPSLERNTGTASNTRRKGVEVCISSHTIRSSPSTSTSTMSSKSTASQSICLSTCSETRVSVWFTPPSDSIAYVMSKPVLFFTPM